MWRKGVIAFVIASIFSFVPAMAQPAAETPPPNVVDASDNPFRGLHWGAGLVFTNSLGGVGEVTKDSSNTVRVKRANSSAARGAIELHYFFEGTKKGTPSDGLHWGAGPFISLNTSPLDNLSGKTFDSIAVGAMVGFSAFDSKLHPNQHSVNFGIGWLIDTNVKTLAPGVQDNQVTSLASEDLTRITTKSGIMAIFSYNFKIN